MLESHGVEFDTDVLEYPWGLLAVFRDPDGNRLQVRELLKVAPGGDTVGLGTS
jgi:hypothetical protein